MARGPASRPSDRNNEKSTRDCEVFLEMQQLIAIGKLPVEEQRREYAEHGERRGDDPRQNTGGDQQAPAKLEGNHSRQENAGHAELLPIGGRSAVHADDAAALPHEDERQSRPVGKQATGGNRVLRRLVRGH
jgi:hypothetical protein